MIEPVARLRIELQDIEPKIWRRVDVPLSCTLLALHDIIQVLFRWHDAHLFEFRIGEKIYGVSMPDDAFFERRVLQAKGVRLRALLDRGVDRFLYVYDFGDDWRHAVTVEATFDGAADTDYPSFVDGIGRAPPEDVGGPPGFEMLLEAIADPAHEEHDQLLNWHGGPFDPDDIEEDHVRGVLSMFANRRRGPLMSHRSGGRGRGS